MTNQDYHPHRSDVVTDLHKLLLTSPWSDNTESIQLLSTSLFQQACSQSAEDEAQTAHPGDQDADSATMPVSSSWSCQLAACMALEILTLSINRHPAEALLHVNEAHLHTLAWLLLHGGLSLQTSALQYTTALLKALPAHQLHLQSTTEAAASSLASWTRQALKLDPSTLQQWSTAAIQCMQQLLLTA